MVCYNGIKHFLGFNNEFASLFTVFWCPFHSLSFPNLLLWLWTIIFANSFSKLACYILEPDIWILCKQISFQFLGKLLFQFLFYCIGSLFKILFFYFNLFARKEKQKQNKNRKALLSHCHLLTVLSSLCSILSLSVKRQRNLIIKEKSVFFYFFNILILFSKHSQNEIYILATLPNC